MKKPLFNPRDLRRVRELCVEGTILSIGKAPSGSAGPAKFPLSKSGNHWCTTREAARTYFFRRGNKAFREAHI